MSGRLFTEVREKRGLCYSVWAGYSSSRAREASWDMPAQATNGPRHAGLFRRRIAPPFRWRHQGRTRSRQDRPQGQHDHAGRNHQRAVGAIAHDFFMRGRIRTLEEIKAAIDAVSGRSGECLSEEPSAGAVHDRDGRAQGIEAAESTRIHRHGHSEPFHHKQLPNGLDIIAEDNPDSHSSRSVCSSRPARATSRPSQWRLPFPRAHDVQGLQQVHLGRREPDLRRDRRQV